MKEQLLKLIYTCIDNPIFYTLDERVIDKECMWQHPQTPWSPKKILVQDEHLYYNHKIDKQIRILQMKLRDDSYENNYIESGMTIQFTDQPKIEIFHFSKVIKEEIITEKFSVDVEVWKKRWYGGSRRVHEEKEYSVVLKKQELELVYCIASGSIKVDITPEEFKKILEKFNENRTRLQNEYDVEKIIERFKKYKKSKK